MIILRHERITAEDWHYLDTLGVNRYNPVMDDSDDYEVAQDDNHFFKEAE